MEYIKERMVSYLSLEFYLLLVIVRRVPFRESCLSPIRNQS